MIPVDSCRSVVIQLVLVAELELIRDLLSRDAHEGIVVGELAFRESDGISCILCVFVCGCGIVGLLFGIGNTHLGGGVGEIVLGEGVGGELGGDSVVPSGWNRRRWRSGTS